MIVLKTLAQLTVASSGTRLKINSATEIKGNIVGVIISSPSGNTGSVWIGDIAVAVGRGTEIPKGTTQAFSSSKELIDINTIYADVGTSGDKVSISYYEKIG